VNIQPGQGLGDTGSKEIALGLGEQDAVSVQAGFITPLPFFAAGGIAVATQGGFRTPLPTFPAGATAAVTQGGYSSLMAFWNGGASAGEAIVEPIPERGGGGAGTEYIRRKDLIDNENAIIMAVIKKFLEVEG